ncbi:MAG: PAS domain-containing protein, partial [Promethearchaeota archaeon]
MLKLTHKDLLEDKRFLQGVLSSIGDTFFFIFDEKGMINFCWGSKKLEEKYGIILNEYEGKFPDEYLPDIPIEDKINLINLVFDTEESVKNEWIVNMPTGRFWFEFTFSPIKVKNEEINCIIAVVKDITERKRAEEKLIENEEKYRTIIEQLNDGIIIVQDSIIQYVNQTMCKIVGYSYKEYVSKPYTITVHPDEMFKVTELCKKRIEGKNVPKTYELALIDKNGNKVYVEYNAILIPYEGKTADLIIVRNISKRKKAENLLIEEKNLLRMVIDNLQDYIFVKDTKGRFILNNLAHISRMVGSVSSQEDLIGKTDFDFFPKEIAEQYVANDQEIIKLGQPLKNRIETVINSRGTEQVLITSKIPRRNNQGEIIGIISSSTDITDLKRTEEALRENENIMRAILANSPDVILIVDQEGVIQFINHTF